MSCCLVRNDLERFALQIDTLAELSRCKLLHSNFSKDAKVLISTETRIGFNLVGENALYKVRALKW